MGISINGGDFATNSRSVMLDLVWPQGATMALISNDGGFNATGGVRAVPIAATTPWTLDAPRASTVDVYVRYIGAGEDSITYSDNIVFDNTRPSIATAAFEQTPSTKSAGKAHRVTRGAQYSVRVTGSARMSGISTVQVSLDRSGGDLADLARPMGTGERQVTVTIPATLSTPPRYVRIANSAGTWSAWVPVRAGGSTKER
jgi:hypothetical protein